MRIPARSWLLPTLGLCLVGAGCCSLPDLGGEAPPASPTPSEAAPPSGPVAALGQALAGAVASQQPEAPPPETPAAGTAPALDPATAMAQAMAALGKVATGPDGQPLAIVSWESLLPMLPAVPAGWTADEPHGETSALGNLTLSEVSRTYHNGDQTFHVKLTDSSLNPAAIQLFAMAGLVNRSSTDGYERGGTLAGMPIVEKWSKGDAEAGVTGLVAKRFILEVRATGQQDAARAKELFQAANLGGLASLK
ncbi:MAG: hypothetical protein RBU45_08995 [Myxococcota bacterium]|jgi:hypothetical protein|nr:hypothetical protein [Myxococcota bacterium]